MPPISPEDWQRLEPLFDQLLDLSPDKRQSWLRDFPELNDPDRDHLRDLLSAHESADCRLDTPLPQAASQLVASSMTDPLIGETLGPFRVGEEIGRGGMGVVYRGIRTDGEFTQEVVIKVLRLGIDSEDTRRRFIQERQILANLDHPCIVRLLDGGFTADGRPYLVMNRVVGQSINSYCDQQKMDVKSRVRLFLNVVEAVGHAHLHLVIHRDLKSGNVWVDESGKVHLLDFGIAKIVDQGGAADVTLTGHRVMTPEYASPEQFRNEDITTASDVYQLGALLYQLLTGRHAFDLAGQSPAEMEKQICDTDPVAPSRAVTSAIPESEDPARVKKILRGDMDLILQKAMRKEPGRRYQSAHEFREDLIRWLSGDRILARPNSVGYQLRRFVRRHPLGVTLLATVAVCSIGFTFFHVQRITSERDIARLEAVRRMEVSDFLVNLLRVPDPTKSQGREVTARELLEDSFARIDEDLSDPETKIRLLRVVGEVAGNLGLYDKAGPALAHVVTYTTEIYGRRSLETATAQIQLAELLRLDNKSDEAIVPATDALSIRRELLPAGDLEIGRALKEVALIHRNLREFDLAETELREAIAIIEAELQETDPLYTAVNVDLAYVLRAVGKMDEAEVLYRQTIPTMRERGDEFQRELPGALNNLGYLLRKKEEYAEAENFYREAVILNESYYGEAHPSTLMFRNNLASVLRMQDKNAEVRRELRTIIDQQEHLTGPEHWRTGVAHRSLGYFLFATGDYGEAVPELKAAHEIFKKGLGADHLWTATAAMQTATCLHLNSEPAEADRLYLEARPLLDTKAAREDRNAQRNLELMIEGMPAGEDLWLGKLSGLMAAADEG